MSNDKELSDLTEVTSLGGDEILYVVDDPSGTQLDRKVTVTNLLAAGNGTYQPLAARLTTLAGRTDATEAAALRTAALDAVYDPAHSRYTGLGSAFNVRIDPAAYKAMLVNSALTIATGIGTGNDIVEPSVLFDATAPFLGYEYVLCASPYYQSNAVYENPTLWVSHDGGTWVPVVNGVPTIGGTPSAIVPSGVQGDGQLSDPYIVRGPDGTYYILWNQFLIASPGGTGTGGNTWSVKGISASTLAGPWSNPVTLVATVTGTDRPSSPSMFWDGQQWVMYCVDSHNTSATVVTKYTNPSSNPLSGTWTKQSNPSITLPTAYSGQVWWHLNAYRIGTQHVLFIQDNAAGSTAGGNLWLVTSDDQGATFTVPPTPMIATGIGYRSAIVPMATAGGWVFDVFYGLLSTTWQLRRTTATAARKYGGVNADGLPINAVATEMAKVPVAPYVFGDTCRRADSAATPGSSDSGTAYSVTTGTAGISSNQIYAAVAPIRAAATVSGAADGVASCEFSVCDNASQQWLITRYLNSSNYIRFGYQAGWQLQNIVSASVAQSGTILNGGAVANGDILTIVCVGTAIYAYVNGFLSAVATGWTSNQTNSGIGVQTSSTTARYRNLTLRPLVGGA